MFNGEYESLKAIEATNIIKVPKPFAVVENPKGGYAFIMEYIDFSYGNSTISDLGNKLAKYFQIDSFRF